MASKNQQSDRIEPKIEVAVIKELTRQDSRLPSSYTTAHVIRRMRVEENCGTVDIMLLPTDTSLHKLVLVEAKHIKAPDAAAKVVGQLLMYYAGALRLGRDSIGRLHTFGLPAKSVDLKVRPLNFIAAQRVVKLPSSTPDRKRASWDMMYAGDKLLPQDIGLYVAIDGMPRRSLCHIIGRLYDSHCLDIGVVQTNVANDNRRVKMVVKPSEKDNWAAFCAKATAV